MLGVFAHPDDAEIAAGGVLAKWAAAGREVHLLILTNGDRGSQDPARPRAEIAATITESVFEYLDAPIFRVTAPDVPAMPFAPTMEHEFLPNVDKIIAALRQAAAY